MVKVWSITVVVTAFSGMYPAILSSPFGGPPNYIKRNTLCACLDRYADDVTVVTDAYSVPAKPEKVLYKDS